MRYNSRILIGNLVLINLNGFSQWPTHLLAGLCCLNFSV